MCCECEVARLTLFFAGLGDALLNVSFEIKGGERCGIVAAKGSRGQSSLIAALFRMTELTSGRIVIDGQDISRLGLVRLRRAMSWVPQEPVLFAGSIRKNLDPLSLHSDEDVSMQLLPPPPPLKLLLPPPPCCIRISPHLCTGAACAETRQTGLCCPCDPG